MTDHKQDDPNPIIAWAVRSMQEKIERARATRDQETATARVMEVVNG